MPIMRKWCIKVSLWNDIMTDYRFNTNQDNNLDDSTDGEDRQDTIARLSWERRQAERKASELSAVKKRQTTTPDTTDQFTEPNQNLQIRLPKDLIRSLKLQAIQEDRSISSIVFDLITTQNVAERRHVRRSKVSDAA